MNANTQQFKKDPERPHLCPNFLKKDFIYLLMRERERERVSERQRYRQREKQALCREPDAGLDPRT